MFLLKKYIYTLLYLRSANNLILYVNHNFITPARGFFV